VPLYASTGVPPINSNGINEPTRSFLSTGMESSGVFLNFVHTFDFDECDLKKKKHKNDLSLDSDI